MNFNLNKVGTNKKADYNWKRDSASDAYVGFFTTVKLD